MIKLVAFDIDGVLTNGTYLVDGNGNESKIISFKDLDSFNLIKKLNIKTLFITSEKNSLTEYFNTKFKPDAFFDGAVDKLLVLKEYLRKKNYNLSEVCYVGDGKKDLNCIQEVGLSICPSNSISEVKEKAKYILKTSGGDGVLYDVYHILKEVIGELNKKKTKNNGDFYKILDEHMEIIQLIKSDNDMNNSIEKAIKVMKESLKKSGVIFSCGNGGSAADSQHFTAELVGKFAYNRKSIPAIALTTNSSIITSIGNDFSFDNVFERQLEGLGREGDVLLAVTTSGNSKNIALALEMAKKKQMKTILLTSNRCINGNADIIIKCPSNKTERIQEIHIMIIHYICAKIEEEYI